MEMMRYGLAEAALTARDRLLRNLRRMRPVDGTRLGVHRDAVVVGLVPGRGEVDPSGRMAVDRRRPGQIDIAGAEKAKRIELGGKGGMARKPTIPA